MAMVSSAVRIGWRILSGSRLAVEGYVEQEAENHNWNQGHQRVEENLLPPRRASIFPVVKFRALGDSDLFWVLEVAGKVAGTGIAVLGHAFERAIDDLLELRSDG